MRQAALSVEMVWKVARETAVQREGRRKRGRVVEGVGRRIVSEVVCRGRLEEGNAGGLPAGWDGEPVAE